MLSDNIQYEVGKAFTFISPISPGDNVQIESKTYAGRELTNLLGGVNGLSDFVNNDRVIMMILTSTLSIFHTFPATYHLALLMVWTFHSSLDMHDAAHTMMISDIATSAWLIEFCHKVI